MKKTLLLLLLTLLSATASNAEDFTYTYEGQTLTYTVIDEDAKTCMTKEGDLSSGAHSISGSLAIPSSASGYTVTAIGKYSFMDCKDLTKLTIPTSVSYIRDYAFRGCSGLTSVDIPESVTTIESGAFQACTGLTSVNIPESVKLINWYAFGGCTSLVSVYIPKFCHVSSRAFSVCKSLISFEVDPENANHATIDGVLFNKNYTTLETFPAGKKGDYKIPATVTEIYYNAFSSCDGLTSISIPESVVSIEDFAFSHCTGLSSVIIPNSVTSIGQWVFDNCKNLTTLSILGSVESWGVQAFRQCDNLTEVYCYMDDPWTAPGNTFSSKAYENATLYVPAGTVSLYQATTPWNLFKNITDEPLLSGIEDVVADGVDAIDYTQPYEVYNLQGALVGQSTDGLAAGVYIVRQGEKSAKVAIR
ncbi:MAG: leucine-rich repeat domain-containing protein [Paramuribaculum sp.]|nr:leucine-rich repeat domain-containing protein [Paramuribaculum sp.]